MYNNLGYQSSKRKNICKLVLASHSKYSNVLITFKFNPLSLFLFFIWSFKLFDFWKDFLHLRKRNYKSLLFLLYSITAVIFFSCNLRSMLQIFLNSCAQICGHVNTQMRDILQKMDKSIKNNTSTHGHI